MRIKKAVVLNDDPGPMDPAYYLFKHLRVASKAAPGRISIFSMTKLNLKFNNTAATSSPELRPSYSHVNRLSLKLHQYIQPSD